MWPRNVLGKLLSDSEDTMCKRGRWNGPVSVEDILWPRNVLGKLPETIIAHIAAAMKEQGMANSSFDRGAARGIFFQR